MTSNPKKQALETIKTIFDALISSLDMWAIIHYTKEEYHRYLAVKSTIVSQFEKAFQTLEEHD